MQNALRNIALLIIAALLGNQFAYAADAPAQLPANAAPSQVPAPVPAQIAAAHNVFLSNTGADPNFPMDATLVYNNLYTALQAWGHYKLVNTPAEADLIFQIHDAAPITDVSGDRNGVYSTTAPSFQLTILDAKTNTTLWTVSSPVALAGSKQTLARWQSIAVTNLVSRVKILANQPLSPTEMADLTTFPKGHGTRAALIVLGSLAVLGVGTYLIVNHENNKFADELNQQKQQQDQFCIAHGIPLSECAGG